MIDLHSHILPNIDDGSSSMEMSLEMASIAAADGVEMMACTPHVMPGIYDNSIIAIMESVRLFAAALKAAGIPLAICEGADIHVTPTLVKDLQTGKVPSLGGSRYFLFEPPHHIRLPGLASLAKKLLESGYVPILTHPERLTWIEDHYDTICQIGEAGAAIQLTAASVTGNFGKRARYWSHRMLDEGRVDLVASDAHDTIRRPPGLSRARDEIIRRNGEEAARLLTQSNPQAIIENGPLAAKPVGQPSASKSARRNLAARWLGRTD
jgi:protein-tyrosine phosphatase